MRTFRIKKNVMVLSVTITVFDMKYLVISNNLTKLNIWFGEIMQRVPLHQSRGQFSDKTFSCTMVFF